MAFLGWRIVARPEEMWPLTNGKLKFHTQCITSASAPHALHARLPKSAALCSRVTDGVRVHDAHDPCSSSAGASKARLNMAAANAALRRIAKNKTLVRRFQFGKGIDAGRYVNFNY